MVAQTKLSSVHFRSVCIREQRFWLFFTKWSLPDRKWTQNRKQRHIYKIRFLFVQPFRSRLAISDNISKHSVKCKIRCWVRIRWKNSKISAKRSHRPKTFAHSNKKIPFSVTFLLITFRISLFATFSMDSKSASNSAFSDTHIAFLKNIFFKSY